MEVLRRNGIRVIIPKAQVCCGSPLIRTGQVAYIDTLRQRNIETFRSRGIDTVLTMCAGCGTTLKNDYKTPFRVIDINELLVQYGIEPPAVSRSRQHTTTLAICCVDRVSATSPGN